MTDIGEELGGAENGLERPAGALRMRTAEMIGVSFPKRTIELIVTPYEEETSVPHQGRIVTEIFSRGAYDGIERRANRIRVNRDHQRERTVGRALSLHPSRVEGLVAEVRIAQTPLGDETLTLADEGILDASAGYLPMAGGEKWETRNRVRVTRAWLGHIAMTPDPAYESANVLAVRNASTLPEVAQPVSTPNLARLEIQRLREEYAALDARWQR